MSKEALNKAGISLPAFQGLPDSHPNMKEEYFI